MVGRRRDGLDRGGPGPHAGTAAEYADEGLDGGTTRYCRVRAFNEAGEGEWSAVASATTNLHLVLEGPGAPENLSASALRIPVQTDH